MTDTRIAVLMPCHNYGRYLREALHSVAAQTLPPAEVVVVDDGSEDETGSVLAAVVSELPGLPLRVVRHETPMGVVASTQEAIRLTDSPLFVTVDADDTVEPRYLEQLAGALRAHPDVGFAYPRIRLFGSEEGVFATHEYDVARLLFEGNYIPHVALIRRAAFATTRGYRELPTHVDWDLWLSFAEVGWRGVLVDEVLYNWRRHPGAMTHQPSSTRLRARLDIMRTHWRLVLRNLLWAVPWTAAAVWRRVRLRLPGHPRVRRTPSAWVESEARQ